MLALVLLAVGTHGTPFWLTSMLMTGLVVAICIRPEHLLMPVLTTGGCATWAIISYGIYLMHMISLNLVRRVVPGPGCRLLPADAGAEHGWRGLSYRYFESPSSLKDRLTAGPSLAKPSPAPSTAPASSPTP